MFTVTTKTTDAAYPRYYGSTLLPSDRLKIVYDRYESTNQQPRDSDFITLNLIFAHGTGLNKDLWKYYIEHLYKYSSEVGPSQKWWIRNILSIDSATHGDSALLNEGKLGWKNRWEDGGRDINRIIENEQLNTGSFYNDATHKNILIGHSLGACQSVFSAAFQPNLYDLVFMIETVGFTDESLSKDSIGRINRLVGLIPEEFDSEKEFDTFYRKFNFTRKFHPRVLDDIIKHEKYEVVKPNGEKKWRAKASGIQQLTSYMSGKSSIPNVMAALPLLKTSVIHVAAAELKFNPPQTPPFIRRTIPAEYITGIDIPGADHNVNGESPDEVIALLKDALSKRAALAHENTDFYAEVKYKGDREKILKEKWKEMLTGWWVEEKPKL